MRRACIVLTVVLAAAGAAAGTIPFRLAATPDPLRSASLPLDLAPAAAGAAGGGGGGAARARANRRPGAGGLVLGGVGIRILVEHLGG